MLAHSQGTFSGVVHFRTNTTAPAVGLSRVPRKTTKTTLLQVSYGTTWHCMLVSWLHEPETKTHTQTRLVLVRARTAVKILLKYRKEKIKSNLWNHIFKLQRQCRGAWKLLSLCHTAVVRAPKSPSSGGAFWEQTCS